MGGDRLWLALEVLPEARSDDDRASQGDEASHPMHDAGAGEVDRAMAEVPVDAALSQPASAPDPVRVDAIRQRNPQAEEYEVLPRPAFRHRARGDGGRGVHEHHHEEE